jgi:hypothetical protein
MDAAANQAIGQVLQHGSAKMHTPPRTEVGFVAAVTLGGIKAIAKTWKPILAGAGLTLDLTGVFCHAAPIVNFTGSKRQAKSCELADLLVVVDVTRAGLLEGRAALVQAKMARAAGRVSLSGMSTITQLDLYQNWHVFDFEDGAYGMSGVNFVAGGGAAYSGTFGVIDRHFKNVPIWTQHAARPTPLVTARHVMLGTFIAEMARGARAGYGRPATPSLKTDWSETIERLLSVTYSRAFHHKATLGSVSAPRGVTACACLSFANAAILVKPVLAGWDGEPPDVSFREDDGRPSGISVLHARMTPTAG